MALAETHRDSTEEAIFAFREFPQTKLWTGDIGFNAVHAIRYSFTSVVYVP